MSVKYGIKILIDFECMMDIDYAIYMLIKYKYNKKPGVFYDYLMDSVNDKHIKTVMLTRSDINPLSAILTKDYLKEADSLYKQIIEADYNTILNVSEPNDIFGLMETYLKTEDIISVTVLCKDQAQSDIIKKLDSSGKMKFIISDRKNVDLTKFDTIWVGKYISVLDYNQKQLNGKHIYTLRAKYNLEPDKTAEIPKLDVSVCIVESNKLSLASAYKWFEMPVEPLAE